MLTINDYNKINADINLFWNKILRRLSPKKKKFKNYISVDFPLDDLINHYTMLYRINKSRRNNINKIFLDISKISDDTFKDVINILKKKKKLFRFR